MILTDTSYGMSSLEDLCKSVQNIHFSVRIWKRKVNNDWQTIGCNCDDASYDLMNKDSSSVAFMVRNDLILRNLTQFR